MRLVHYGNKFVLEDSSYEERHVPKEAGFRWNPDKRRWWTDDPAKAYRLYEYAAGPAKAVLDAAPEVESIRESHALDASVEFDVPPGLAYYGYQKGGISYALSRPCTLFGDEMGVGKTIQAIGVMNAMGAKFKNALVICPASLKLNWQRELEKWLVPNRSIGVASGTTVPSTDIVIINYDIVKRNWNKLTRRYSVIVCDESHYLKNKKAQRTQFTLALIRKSGDLQARHTLFLTGTPILNRPVELWTTLSTFSPSDWPSFMWYAKRYCNAFHNGFGWDFTGASRLDELQNRLRSKHMVRRLKKDVLTELPPKVRQVIEIPNPQPTASQREMDAYEAWEDAQAELADLRKVADSAEDPDQYEAQIRALQDRIRAGFEELSTLRREAAEMKAPLVIDFIKEALESSAKVVVFAHHVSVIEQIAGEFGEQAVKLYGAVPTAERQAAVDRFQTDDTCRVFVGGITAAGVGITLTASSHVIFAELDWVPGNLTQAEDRCHRIGQDSESVLIQHIVLENSLDAKLSHTIIEKQKVIVAAMDADTQIAYQEPKRKPKAKEQPTLDAKTVHAIHQGLKCLAEWCDGANALDDMGFNKFDTDFGKKLAAAESLTPKQAAAGQKLVRKYRRQLPDELLEVALT